MKTPSRNDVKAHIFSFVGFTVLYQQCPLAGNLDAALDEFSKSLSHARTMVRWVISDSSCIIYLHPKVLNELPYPEDFQGSGEARDKVRYQYCARVHALLSKLVPSEGRIIVTSITEFFSRGDDLVVNAENGQLNGKIV